jgi:hypothetical protein
MPRRAAVGRKSEAPSAIFPTYGISASKKFFFDKKNQKTSLILGRDCFTNSA